MAGLSYSGLVTQIRNYTEVDSTVLDTDTATNGDINGGGVGCSVGPVTLSA